MDDDVRAPFERVFWQPLARGDDLAALGPGELLVVDASTTHDGLVEHGRGASLREALDALARSVELPLLAEPGESSLAAVLDAMGWVSEPGSPLAARLEALPDWARVTRADSGYAERFALAEQAYPQHRLLLGWVSLPPDHEGVLLVLFRPA